MVTMSPTSPAASYRPTYGVTYQGQMQPTSGVPMAPTSRTPLPSMLNPPRPGMPPARPAGVVPGMQQPTMGLPALAPAAGGALTGANGLSGAPSPSMPMNGNPVQPGAYALTPGYSGVNMGLLGPGLMAAGAAGVPGAGLLNMGLHGYNTYNYDDARRTQGLPGLDFGQWLGGILGLNDYGSGAPNALQSLGRATLPSGSQVIGNTEARSPNNAGFGTRTAGGPMQLNPGYSAPGFFGRMFGDSTGVGATDRTTGGDRMGRDASQVAAGVGVGLGGIY